MLPRACAVLFFFALIVIADGHGLDQAVALQQQGKLKEAQDILRITIPALRSAADRPNLARALSIAAQISISLGDYDAARSEAGEAVDLRRNLKDEAHIAEDLTTAGLAQLYLGNYPAAIAAYEQALAVDRKRGNAEGEAVLLNNIGNAFYFQGRYLDALRSYEAAMEKVNAGSAEKWSQERRQLTLANLAALYQRLGNESRALELYQQLGKNPALPASGRAQLLLNEGALYRRMGDPIKALEMYRTAESLFAVERHRDGEIGALRNTGIVLTMDTQDLPGALKAFTAALKLAEESGNTRGIAQMRLYRAELQRRVGRLTEARSDALAALAAARQAGLTEEQWKSHYALGRIAEDGGEYQIAFDSYRKAVDIVESVRTRLIRESLKKDFLADKRDVYDSLIALRLRDAAPSPRELFRWIERGRARTFLDRLGRVSGNAAEADVQQVQKKLAADTVLLDFWIGERMSAVLWMTKTDIGFYRIDSATARLNELASTLLEAVQGGTTEWQQTARVLGGELLRKGLLQRHVLIVPDGRLGAVPFEILSTPGSNALLIEGSDVSYLPSAQFVLERGRARGTQWVPPWRRELVAFGDPTMPTRNDLEPGEEWQHLPTSADEVRSVAAILKGKSEIHLGSDARKQFLADGHVAGVPVVHLSTHATADMESPDRSRIVLAASDHLFQQEVYDLDLRGVDLVTLSACDTARGRFVRGEGIEAFSVAFLSAGAASTVTSLWRVEDQPTTDFMKQFYYFLSRGEDKAEALRSAKLQFLHSPSSLSRPRSWAAFVLSGNGWDPCPRPIPWSVLLAIACAGVLLIVLVARRFATSHSRVTAAIEREQRV